MLTLNNQSDLLEKLFGGIPASAAEAVKEPQLSKPTPFFKEAQKPAEDSSSRKKDAADIVEEPRQQKTDIVSKIDPEMTLASLQQKWEEVIGTVSKNGTSIGTFLSHGEPTKVVGAKVTISFPERYRFQLDVLKKNTRKIETSLQKVFDKELKVDFILQKGDATLTEEKSSNHPVTQRMLELFGGETTN